MAVKTKQLWGLSDVLSCTARILQMDKKIKICCLAVWLARNPVFLLMLITGVLFMFLALLETKDFSTMMMILGLIMGIYSCVSCQVFFILEQRKTSDLLYKLADVARSLESRSNNLWRENLHNRALQIRRVVMYYSCYGSSVILSLFLPPILTGKFYIPIPTIISQSSVQIGVQMAQMLGLMATACGYYGIIILCATTSLVVEELFLCVAAQIRDLESYEDAREVIRVHQDVIRIVSQLERLYSKYILHFLFGLLAVPLLGSLCVAMGYFDSYLLSTLPAIMIIYFPLAIAGSRIEDAFECVSFAAYDSQWTSLPSATRRLLVMLMMRSRKPTSIMIWSSVYVDLESFLSVTKNWYSWFNVCYTFINRPI